MKIVREGIRPPTYHWIGQWECYYCRSIIQLEASDDPDTIRWHDDQRDGESVEMTCPVCEEKRFLHRVGGER